MYSKYAGTELEFDETNHLLLKEDDIVGVLDTDDIKDLKPLGERVLIKVSLQVQICIFICHRLFCILGEFHLLVPSNLPD